MGGDQGDGGAFATGDDEACTAGEVVGVAHFDELEAVFACMAGRGGEILGGAVEEGEMLEEAALEGQHANGDGHGWVGCKWCLSNKVDDAKTKKTTKAWNIKEASV